MEKCNFIKTLFAVCLLSTLGVNSLAEKRQERNALRVVSGVTVGISCTEDAEKAGLEAKIVQRDAALQLLKAGIKVVDKQSGYMPPTIPDLQIRIKAYEISEKQIIVDNIDIFLKQQTALVSNADQKITAITWWRSRLSHSRPQQFVEHIWEQVKFLISEFIKDYQAANQSEAEPADTDKAATPSPKQASLTEKTQPVKFKFVASKNSKVFHKPDCSSAKRIKPENLETYNSRDEAVKAGKRPCKQCKP
ncbi:Ada metal-binding domain-containing protein [Planctomycetota bacterium]